MHYHGSTQLPLTMYVVLIKDVRVLVLLVHVYSYTMVRLLMLVRTRVLEYPSMVKSAPQVKKA